MPRKIYTKRADGRFYTKVTVGRDENGKAIRENVYGSSAAELERKVNDMRYELRHNLYIKSSSMLFGDYAIEWDRVFQVTKRTNTKAMYNNIVHKHIVPAIGYIPIGKLVQSDIQKMINERMDKVRTCQQISMVTKQIVRAAIVDGLIYKDISHGIKLPQHIPTKKRVLTDQEKEAIKVAVFTQREKAFVYILFAFGLRREEALALTQSAFDFKNHTLAINAALVFDKNDPLIEPVKSRYSERVLPIPNFVLPFLKEYIKNLDSLYLFTKSDGNLITKSSYHSMWRNIVKKMNDVICSENESKLNIQKVTNLTAHIFRHNYCTMLYYSNLSIKRAVELMGHKDAKLIMEVYAHLDEEKERTIEKINHAIQL